jgi:hypothetical protein
VAFGRRNTELAPHSRIKVEKSITMFSPPRLTLETELSPRQSPDLHTRPRAVSPISSITHKVSSVRATGRHAEEGVPCSAGNKEKASLDFFLLLDLSQQSENARSWFWTGQICRTKVVRAR